MTGLAYEIMLIACLASVACVLPGVFLVLRGIALMSDAISHAILLGIAIMFMITHQVNSPWLMMGAAISGLLTVLTTEFLIETKKLKIDAAIGLVFPAFFSLGVIIITRYARNVHLDLDMVILGDLAFAPFNRCSIRGFDYGPMALWVISGILITNIIFISLFYKELKLVTFDRDMAYMSGFNPTFLHYGLMSITSITAVGCFDIVGSIVLVAMMITPPATAYLLVNTLEEMLGLSIFIGLMAALSGYIVAHLFDLSIAGSIATCCGILFMFVLVISPKHGLISRYLRTLKK